MKKLPKLSFAFLVFVFLGSVFSSCKKADNLTSPSNVSNLKFTSKVRALNLASNLVAYWPLDSNANDLSGNGHNGTAYNVTSVPDHLGNSGRAYHFDGSSSYIVVPNNAALNLNSTDFTLSAWIKLDSYNSSYGSQIMNKRYSGYNNGWTWSMTGQLSSTTGTLSFGPGGGNSNAFGTKVVSLNQWHMVTSVYTASSQQLAIYIDGVLDNVTTGILSPSASVLADLYIGKDNPQTGSNGYYFQGSLDELRIYNKALSATEVEQLYSWPINGLIAYWPLDGNANDLSGNGHNGTTNNVTSVPDHLGNANGAFHFDGTTSYITVPNDTTLSLGGKDFTLSAWVKLDSYNSSYGSQILNKRYSGYNNGWTWSIAGQLSSTPGVLSFGPGGGSSNAFGTAAVAINQWHMVTSVYTASTQQLAIYIDGALDNTTSGILSPNAAVTADLYMGKDNPNTGSPGYFFQGSMDDVRIYGVALNASQISQLYNSSY
jgi:hypothetical protein